METKHALIIATAIVVGFVAHGFLNVVSAMQTDFQDRLKQSEGVPILPKPLLDPSGGEYWMEG